LKFRFTVFLMHPVFSFVFLIYVQSRAINFGRQGNSNRIENAPLLNSRKYHNLSSYYMTIIVIFFSFFDILLTYIYNIYIGIIGQGTFLNL
jgi:hypothetical protein